MHLMSLDLANLLVEERREEAGRHQQRTAARRRRTPKAPGEASAEVPQQRSTGALLARLVPRIGVRVPTR